MPTTIASIRPRSSWTSARDRSAGDPPAVARRRGRLAVEGHGPLGGDVGQPGRQPLEVRGVELGRGLRRLAGPTSTRCPAARRIASPPPSTLGNGSRIAATTRAMPAAEDRVGARRRLAVVAARFERDVERRTTGGSPACRRATTSACGPPKRAWWPRPTTRPSRTTTAPTIGLGSTGPGLSRPRRGRDSSREGRHRSRRLGPRRWLQNGEVAGREIRRWRRVPGADRRRRRRSGRSPRPRTAVAGLAGFWPSACGLFELPRGVNEAVHEGETPPGLVRG